jgi:hypothetical protein
LLPKKIHGTQFILAHNLEDSKTIVSSKGMLKQGFLLMKPKKVIHTGWLQKNDDIVGIIKEILQKV